MLFSGRKEFKVMQLLLLVMKTSPKEETGAYSILSREKLQVFKSPMVQEVLESSTRLLSAVVISFLGNNQPLYVVDGIPIDNASYETGDNLNRQVDTEFSCEWHQSGRHRISYSVERTRSSCTVRITASNGAVMITTKTGKNMKKVRAKIWRWLSPWYFIWVSTQNYLNSKYIWTRFVQTAGPAKYKLGAPLNGEVLPWGNTVNGVQLTKPYSAQKRQRKKISFDLGRTYTNDLSLSGGGEKTTYYMSIGNNKQYGIMPELNTTELHSKFPVLLNCQTSSTALLLYTILNQKGDLSIQGQQTGFISMGRYHSNSTWYQFTGPERL